MYGNKRCLIAKGYYWGNTRPMNTKWTTENIPSQAGRRAVITGANSGTGFEAALALAHKGAEPILPARTRRRRHTTAEHIDEAVQDPRRVAPIREHPSQLVGQ